MLRIYEYEAEYTYEASQWNLTMLKANSYNGSMFVIAHDIS